ncbi:hypothetical protein BDR03DRAFT_1020685 [Suillus americanus]|nr:hypothetical protein BDR03DRAFT_1020685 [Suillus americanus]
MVPVPSYVLETLIVCRQKVSLPYDVRILVYEVFLANHLCVNQNRQPSNDHIRVSHTCRQIFYEARAIFHKYVSLRNDWEVDHYLAYLDSEPKAAPIVRWADVANDGRVLGSTLDQTGPASRLYLVLAKFVSLFNVRHRDLQEPCFPLQGIPYLLQAHELHLDPSTRVNPFETIPSNYIRSMHLLGDHRFKKTHFPTLRHLTIRGVTSNAFDQIHFNTVFPTVNSIPSSMHKVIDLVSKSETSQFSSAIIASYLHSLPMLEYFAFLLVTVNELRENFILPLGLSLQVLKLQITHAWYAMPLFEEERIICDTIERIHLPHKVEYVSFHSQLMAEHGQEDSISYH